MSRKSLSFLVLLVPGFLAGQPKPDSFSIHKYPGDHLAISIPADWVEIPRAELDQMSANVREAAPSAKPQPYNYGFQASANAKYPRVLVQIKTTGRWPENVFAQLPKLSTSDIQKQVASTSPAFAAMNLELGKITYDPAKRLAWLRMQLTDQDGQSIQGLSGLHPTIVGSIQVHCSSLEADFDRFAPLFSDIIASIQIDDDWRYRETNGIARFLGSSRLGSAAVSGAVGSLAATLVLAFLRRLRRNRKIAGDAGTGQRSSSATILNIGASNPQNQQQNNGNTERTF
jgi:hypothetical protein